MKNYKKKILLFLYASLVVVVGSFSILFVNFWKQVHLQDDILTIEKKLIQTDSLTTNILQIESDKRGFQLTSDVDYLKNFHRIKLSCQDNIAKLKEGVADIKDLQLISSVDSLVKLRIGALDSGIIVFTTKGLEDAVQYMELPSKKYTRTRLIAKLNTLKNNFLQQLDANASGINKRTNRNVAGLLVLVLIFISLMFVAARTFRRSQQRIIKSHTKFKEAQRIARIGSWEWDFASNRLKWSEEQFRIFGEKRKEFDLTYDGYLSHLSEAEQRRTRSLIADALLGKSHFAIEHEIIRKDGTNLMVFEQGTVLFDEAGRPIGMFGTTQDIAERKKTETELLHTKQKFQEFFDNTADGIYQSTVEGRFIMANPAMARLFGYNSPKDLMRSIINIGKQVYVDQDDRKRMQELLMQQGHIENYEVQLLNKLGEKIWVSESTRVVKNEKGEILCFEGTLKDITERKKVEEALHNSKEQYRQIVETAQEGIWVLDENNYTLFVNKKMCDLLEYSREEMMGKQNYDFKDEKGRENAMKDIERRKQGVAETLMTSFLTKSGRKVYTSVSTNPIFDEKGNYVGALGMFTDVTERKKKDEELKQAQKKFQDIFDHTADGIYQSTINGRFIMVNPSMARIFGFDSPAELMDSITDIGSQLYADPADRKRLSELLSLHGHIENYELQVITKTKETIWVSANIRMIKDENGDFSCFEGTLEDISERRKAEEQLHNLSNRLQLAVRATGIGIWDWDIVHNTTVWDEEMFRMYDVKEGEHSTITAAWEAVMHPDDIERVKGELAAAIRNEKEYDTEFRILCKDESIRYIKGSALVLRDQQGNAIRMIGTNGDITQRKNAEEEILQLNKNLEQFANITAHDLQEPIRMVSGFLGLLHKKYSAIIDEQGMSYIERAKDGADRMSILIRDLLEFSRSGNKAAKKEMVDLSSVLELVHRDMTIAMEDSSASLYIPNSMPVVDGTQSALYRLFLNLVSNGIKFRKKDTQPEVTIHMQELNDSWEFTVQDNGIGVPEKDQAKLFQAFQRLHRKEEYPGTGLGLVTCKKIVETHGGKIWMTSEYGKGTGFHFTLPKMRA